MTNKVEVELAKINEKLNSIYKMTERSELTNNDAHAIMNTKQDILNGTVKANEKAIVLFEPLPKKVDDNGKAIANIQGAIKATVVIIGGGGTLVTVIFYLVKLGKTMGWW